MSDSEDGQRTPCKRPSWINVTNSIPKLEPLEVVHGPDVCLNSQLKLHREEQKNKELIMNQVEKFSRPGETVVNILASKSSTVPTFLLFSQQRIFTGCQKAPDCFTYGLHMVLELLSRHELNPKLVL